MVVELGDAIDPQTNARVHALDRRVRAAGLPGVVETVPAYASLLVHLDPVAAQVTTVADALLEMAASTDDRATSGKSSDKAPIVEIPVRYGAEDGPDLADLAGRAGLTPEEVIERHAAGEYRVAMLGFAPGFPYLMGLDPALACPRLDTPRVRVPAGSVAIAERQTGIYPYAMPGGWRLIGRTDVTLFDPQRDPAAAVAPGDRVRFVRSGGSTSGIPGAKASTPWRSGSPPALRVLEPGIQSTVQDAGRTGSQRFGVPPSGAADPQALATANIAVGNDPTAAGLEATMGGVELEFLLPTTFALGGAILSASLDGRGVPYGVAVAARPSQRLRLGRPDAGLRTYLAFRGGVDVPDVLGSRSTYLPAAFGGHEGRALRQGDQLPVGRARATRPAPTPRAAQALVAEDDGHVPTGSAEFPFVPSGQWDRVSRATRDAFVARSWIVSHRSDRMGLRLEGEALPDERVGRGFVSDGTVTGAIQLSGDGMPIVLGVDRQTIGGYPKLGAVATVALHRLGQLRAGDEVSFRPIPLAEARAALAAAAAR